jgi:hypothetical protein
MSELTAPETPRRRRVIRPAVNVALAVANAYRLPALALLRELCTDLLGAGRMALCLDSGASPCDASGPVRA